MPTDPRAKLSSIIQLAQRFRSPLAITGLVLFGVYAIISKVLEVQFAQLTAEGSLQILQTILRYVFIIALVAVILSILAFLLPRILPKSLFIPAPRLSYAVAVFRMFDPFDQGGTARLLDSVELFPGFPYYSRESDHPSAWPPRVYADRTRIYDKFVGVLNDPQFRASLAKDSNFNTESIKHLGGGPRPQAERELQNYIINARSHVLNTAEQGEASIRSLLSQHLIDRFFSVEQERAELRQWFPNRLAVVRVRNIGSQDVLNLGMELEVAGLIYDHKIDADPQKVKNANWDDNAHRVTFERLPREYSADIRIWYSYQSLSEKAFPDKIDIIRELTQGVRILNISASRTRVAYDPELLEDLQGYERLYLGDAPRKDSYDKEIGAFLSKKDEQLAEHFKDYEKKNPTLSDLDISALETLDVAEDQIDNIWLGLKSPSGREYGAVHVFKHVKGPYVLLTNKDKDEADLKLLQSRFVDLYNGVADSKISDRGSDISTTVEVATGFTKLTVANAARALAKDGYTELIVSKLHYHTD